MSTIINSISRETISVDDNSIYRALNRFETIELVKSELQRSELGPQRRYYNLTKKGSLLLKEFIQRNILVFETSDVAARIQSVLNNEKPSA